MFSVPSPPLRTLTPHLSGGWVPLTLLQSPQETGSHHVGGPSFLTDLRGVGQASWREFALVWSEQIWPDQKNGISKPLFTDLISIQPK